MKTNIKLDNEESSLIDFNILKINNVSPSKKKCKRDYSCIFPSCPKSFKTYFRWNIHYNSHVSENIVLLKFA